MMTYPKMMILSILQVCLVTVTGFQQKPGMKLNIIHYLLDLLAPNKFSHCSTFFIYLFNRFHHDYNAKEG